MSSSTASTHCFLGLSFFLPFILIFIAIAGAFSLLILSTCPNHCTVFDSLIIPSIVQHQSSLVLAYFLFFPSVFCRISFKAFSFGGLYSPYIIYHYWPTLCYVTYCTSDIHYTVYTSPLNFTNKTFLDS